MYRTEIQNATLKHNQSNDHSIMRKVTEIMKTTRCRLFKFRTWPIWRNRRQLSITVAEKGGIKSTAFSYKREVGNVTLPYKREVSNVTLNETVYDNAGN